MPKIAVNPKKEVSKREIIVKTDISADQLLKLALTIPLPKKPSKKKK